MKQILENSTLSPVQLAKCVKSLKSVTETHEQFEKLKEEILPEAKRERLEQIISGLEQEDEFAIVCHLMGTCDSLVRIEQTPLVPFSLEKPSDFMASFRPGCQVLNIKPEGIGRSFRCFVEVKSCEKNIFKISERDLGARVAFANRFSLPLVFAIRFTCFRGSAYWLLVTAEELQANGRRLGVVEIGRNIRHLLFDDYMLLPLPNLHVAHYYDSEKQGTGIRHGEFGLQTHSVLLFSDQQIPIPNQLSFFLSAMFDAFSPECVDTKRDGKIACQVLKLGASARSLMDILYAINRLVTDASGRPNFDAGRIAARFDSESGKHTFFPREYVEWCAGLSLRRLAKPLFVKIAFEKPEVHLERLTKLLPTPE